MHPFKAERVAQYDTGLGMTEQRRSPGFQIISKVKRERELWVFRFFLNWCEIFWEASNIIQSVNTLNN